MGYDANAGRVFNAMLAFLCDMSLKYGVTCLLTAQVSGFDDEVKMSGFQVLRYWCDNVIRLDRLEGSMRRLFIELPNEVNLEVRYTITSKGIELLSYGH